MNSLKFLLFIFEVFGLATWSPGHRSFRREKFLLGWKCVHFAGFFVQNYIVVTNTNQIFASNDIVTFLTDFVQYLGPGLTHFIILVEMMYYYRLQRRIWTLIHELKVVFSGLRTDLQFSLESVLRKFLIEAAVTASTCWIIEGKIIYNLYNEVHLLGVKIWLHHWYCKILPFSIGRMSLIFHAFFIAYVDFFMQLLIDEVHYIGTVSRRTTGVQWKLVHQRLATFKEAYTKIAQLNEHSNKMFGFSHASNMLGLFILIAACWYYDCANIKSGTGFMRNIESYLSAVAPMLIVLYFCLKCEAALQTVAKFPAELHRIVRPPKHTTISQLILLFELQIKQQPIRFSANGFFDVGSDFLKDLVSQIVSYIIIFVQFMPDSYIEINYKKFQQPAVANNSIVSNA